MEDINDLNPPLSPSDEGTADDQSQNDGQPAKKSAEARINELLARNKQMEQKLKDIEVRVTTPPPSPLSANPETNTPEVQKAADFLKKMGFVHEEQLKQRDSVMESRMQLNSEHAALESKYNGNDGRPTYDRGEVEQYMRSNGIFGSPESAYKLLHEVELLDWTLKQAETKRPKKASVIKPGGVTSETGEGESEFSREKLDQALYTPEGRAWYERNRDKIMDLVSKGQL